MRADVGLASRRSADRQETVQAGGRTLLIAGAVVAAVAAVVYLVALATHPMGRHAQAGSTCRCTWAARTRRCSHSAQPLHLGTTQTHPGIQFTYTPFAALLFAAGPGAPVHGADGAGHRAVAARARRRPICDRVPRARLAGRRPRLGATLLLSRAWLLWTEPVQRALFLGQVELVLMALVVWDLCQPDRRRWKGAATGLAAGIKLVPLLFIAYLLLTRRFRQAAVAGGRVRGHGHHRLHRAAERRR